MNHYFLVWVLFLTNSESKKAVVSIPRTIGPLYLTVGLVYSGSKVLI
jgi:hypothetical protein